MKPTLLTLLFASLFCLPAIADDPVLFRAEYVAAYGGLPVRAKGVRELVRLDENRYQLVSSATSVLASVTETTDFWLEDTSLSPLSYSYERTGLGKNKSESSEFDWANNLIEHDGSSSTLTPGTLDKLSYQYQLRIDVARAIAEGDSDTILDYNIADEEKRKHYRFRISDEEVLETPVGELRTVKVERVRADSDRQTTLWLAIDHEFLLVRLKQIENDRRFELNLQTASLDGEPL